MTARRSTSAVGSPGFPQPAGQPGVGHLGRWGLEPLRLLEEGAALGSPFELRLWRRAVVGFTPAWNRLVLRDLDTFRSAGSLSRLTPYLNGGVVLTDAPEHAARRRVLNPHLHARALGEMRPRLAAIARETAPTGRFDGLAWASEVVRRMLDDAFFGGAVGDRRLASFVAPLDRPIPHPFLPRPVRVRRMTRAIRRVVAAPTDGTLAGALLSDARDDADVAVVVEELRIALAAAYDTTAHTLAWAAWHVAEQPALRAPELLDAVVDETLRLYPAGWIGSRIAARDVALDERVLRAGTLVLYSPYLSHRDPALWDDPLAFRPERFADGRPAWGYVPFSAGERTCLGMHLALIMLRTAVAALCEGADLRTAGPAPRLVAGLTLRPAGGVPLERRPRSRS